MVKELITDTWKKRAHSRVISVVERLRNCRKGLSKWKKNHNMNARDRLHQLELNLEEEQSVSFPCIQRLMDLKRELVKAYIEDELFGNKKIHISG